MSAKPAKTDSVDVRLSTAFFDHPKTKKLGRRLGDPGILSLIRLFAWTRVNRTDGDLSGMDCEDIEIAADWQGQPGTLIETLASLRFVDGEPGGHSLHGWSEHQSWAVGTELRKARGRWNIIKRHHGEAEADAKVPEWAAERARETAETPVSDTASNTASTTDSSENDASSNTPQPYALALAPALKKEKLKASAIAPLLSLLKKRGLALDVRPTTFGLAEAFAERVTVEALADAIGEGVTAGKDNPVAWGVKAARGRHADGAAPATPTKAAPVRPSSVSTAERMRQDRERDEQANQEERYRAEESRRVAALSDHDVVVEARNHASSTGFTFGRYAKHPAVAALIASGELPPTSTKA